MDATEIKRQRELDQQQRHVLAATLRGFEKELAPNASACHQWCDSLRMTASAANGLSTTLSEQLFTVWASSRCANNKMVKLTLTLLADNLQRDIDAVKGGAVIKSRMEREEERMEAYS
jgi:hypothetical protein